MKPARGPGNKRTVSTSRVTGVGERVWIIAATATAAMSDIVIRLRRDSKWTEGLTDQQIEEMCNEAADEIEMLRGVEQDAAEWVEEQTKRLRADNARLRAALRPFAVASDSYDDEPPARVIASKRGAILSVYDLRLAKAALGQEG